MQHNRRLKPSIKKYVIKTMIVIIITLVCLIIMKSNSQFKTDFYKYVYDTNFSFRDVTKIYNKYFGSSIYEKNKDNEVSSEKIAYNKISKYKDGAKLEVANNYAIPIQESGIVVFIGEREGYGKVVIIQQNNGIDMWYGNISNTNVSLYSYVNKGSILGECNKYLYVVYKKNGEILSYEDKI